MGEERERFMTETLARVRQLAAMSTTEPPSLWKGSNVDVEMGMRELLEDYRNRQRLAEIERQAGYHQAMQRIRAVTEQHA